MFKSVVILMMKLPDTIFDMRNCDEMPCKLIFTIPHAFHPCFDCTQFIHFNNKFIVPQKKALFRSSLISPWMKLKLERDPYRTQKFCEICIYIPVEWCTTSIFFNIFVETKDYNIYSCTAVVISGSRHF